MTEPVSHSVFNDNNPKELDVEMNEKDEEMEEGEASDDDNDVEVNVIIGVEDNKPRNRFPTSLPDPIIHRPPGRRTPPCYAPNDFLDDRPSNIPSGSFVTGVCEVDERTLVDRAKRFGGDTVMPKAAPTPQAVKQLYKSLGVDHSDFIGGWWHSEVIHVYSADVINSTQVMQYFQNYAPISITWNNTNECNVHWSDSNGPIRALLGLSCPIHFPGDASEVGPLPRPPTRRHNTPPPPTLALQQDAFITAAISENKVSKKKSKKKKKSDDSSSDDSSSSDSDSDSSSSSSSDSSSSDSDSSDSDSDSSSDSSSSSSSSSSDSDSSDSEKTKKKKLKKKAKAAAAKLKKVAKAEKKQQQKQQQQQQHQMLVEDRKSAVKLEDDPPAAKAGLLEEKQLPGSVLVTDIPLRTMPRGRWRLGVPSPNTRVLLMRFGHTEDIGKEIILDRQKDHYIVDGDGHRKRRRRHNDESKSRDHRKRAKEGVKARLSGPMLHPSARMPPAPGPLPPYRPPPHLPHLPPGVERSYRDLDDPVNDPEHETQGKDPWGGLAMNWGKKETQPFIDYQAMLHKHVSVKKRKRSSSDEEGDSSGQRSPDRRGPPPDRRPRGGGREERPRTSRQDGRFRPDHRTLGSYSDSDGDDRRRPDDDDDDEEQDGARRSDASDDVVAWSTKMTLPRMKMYADVEEKKRKVSKPKRLPRERWPRDVGERDAPQGAGRSIFSRLGGGDGPHRRPHSDRDDRPLGRRSAHNDGWDDRSSKRPRRDSDDHGSGFRSGATTTNVRSRLGGGPRY